jgi:cellulose synthase/poly-beta-1,6-N-acetylglucosamine synthase-like glycosyltransferase
MPLDGAPRVTLGIATYNRDTYLEAAIRSSLDQDFDALEVLVVLDGTTNPAPSTRGSPPPTTRSSPRGGVS